MPVEIYTKEYVARAQIETAVRLYTEHADYLAAITLAGAAEEILGKLVMEGGGRSALSSLQDAAVEMHKHLFGEPGDAKWVADRANRARNSLKHLTTTAGREVAFDPAEEAADILDRAITNHWRYTQTLTPAMEQYEHRRRTAQRDDYTTDP